MNPSLVEHKFIPIKPSEPVNLPSPKNVSFEKYISCNNFCFILILFMTYMLWSRYKNYEKPLMQSYDKTEPRPYNI